jgi:hypothetical protein
MPTSGLAVAPAASIPGDASVGLHHPWDTRTQA